MHIRVAQRLGVTKEEIFDAILIAGTLSNAAVLAEGTRAMDSEKWISRIKANAVFARYQRRKSNFKQVSEAVIEEINQFY